MTTRPKPKNPTQARVRREASKWRRVLADLKESELAITGQLWTVQQQCDHPDFACSIPSYKGRDPRTFKRDAGQFTVDCVDCGKQMFYDCRTGELHDGK